MPDPQPRIAIIGLGYVGLPLAVAMAKAYPGTIGFDIDPAKITTLQQGHDPNNEVDDQRLQAASLTFTSEPADLVPVNTFIVAVPTPVDTNKRPDLTPLTSACKTIGPLLTKGDTVIFESTVYPGLTEEICGPALEQASGLAAGTDFHLAYSPERINPGDKERTLEKIVKVVAGDNPKTLERVANLYEKVVHAGIHRAPSIRVAEAAKVIENIQRDLNIALMNELAMIFERLNIRTSDVLEAAATKWNFLPFTPGLVGGHCIGIDPYYLTTKAEEVGYHPQIILAGRRINDNMAAFIAQKTIKLLAQNGKAALGSNIRILGLTFKENVPDIRNSKIPDLKRELEAYGATVHISDPIANPQQAKNEYNITLTNPEATKPADAVILAVPHHHYLQNDARLVLISTMENGIIVDVKSALESKHLTGFNVWSL